MKTLKKRRRFSLADLLILILVLLFLSLVFLIFYRRMAAEGEKKETVYYHVLLSSIDATLFPSSEVINVGATVRNENGTAILGSVTKVILEPHLEVRTDGRRVQILENPSKYDLLVHVSCEAVEKEGQGIRVNDIRIAAGEHYCMRFDGFVFDGAHVIFVKREADG